MASCVEWNGVEWSRGGVKMEGRRGGRVVEWSEWSEVESGMEWMVWWCMGRVKSGWVG